MAGKFECYKDKAGEFRFRLKAGNGETILASEGYTSKSSCTNGIESVKKNCLDESCFEKKTTVLRVLAGPLRTLRLTIRLDHQAHSHNKKGRSVFRPAFFC
jgi:uncharacterized protein YegP (UPF0339 family)